MVALDEDDAAMRREAKKTHTRAKQEKFLQDSAMRALLRSPDGRAYLRWLLVISKAMGHQPYRADPNKTAFICGEMNVGLQIMQHMIEVDAALFADMLKETEDARRTNQPADRGGDQPDLFGDSADDGDAPGDTSGGGEPEVYD